MPQDKVDEKTVAYLAALDYEDFKKIVNDDIRGQVDPSTAQALRGPVAERWYDTLVSMLLSVEGQLAANASDMKVKEREHQLLGDEAGWMHEEIKNERWKAGALRFKTGLEQRIMEARTSTKTNHVPDNTSALVDRVKQLELAIRHHRESFDTEEQPSDEDLQLWSYIENV